MTAGPGTPGTVSSHHAEVSWHGTKQDIRAHTIRAGGLEIAGSCSAQWGGDPAKVDPEDMFVASLSSCHMLWFLDVTRRERLRVTSYEDAAAGTMDGVRFTEVVLSPRVEFEGEVDSATVERLHHDAHERCFLANSVSCPVEVRPA
jgi:organic hydroperoxide reductase OsmC/OhrA